MHYPTEVMVGLGGRISEPIPVEGILICLTAASGTHARFGRLSYQKLYITSHDNLLFFCSPTKAIPPLPLNVQYDTTPATESPEETPDMPTLWMSAPYKLKDGKIQWLEEAKSPGEASWYDKKAQTEYERCVHLVHPECHNFSCVG